MTTPDPSREAFGRHVRTENGIFVRGQGWLNRDDLGAYKHPEIQARWLTWQAAMAHCVSSIPADAITVNLVRHVGLDKHVARECEQIVRQLLQPAAPNQEGST